MLHAQTLLPLLDGLRLGHPLHLYERLGSTNDEAQRLAAAGAREGLLVLAETQTAGRGRSGRSWLTPPGSALALSLVLRPRRWPAAQASRLTLLAAVAVCEAIEQVTPLRAALKWPNDVLVNGRKLAGLLLETALSGDQVEHVVAGIGLNVSFTPPPEVVDFPASSLQAEGAPGVDRGRLLRAILERLEARYFADDPAGLQAAWRARLSTLGQAVRVRLPQGELLGRAEDVDADGALLLRLDSGDVRRVLAGDVHLRSR